ncbi:MAG: hypothetical protein ACYTBJ_05835 [Planctomycetota bacterium]|jgi:hypothetical protein
MNQKQLRAMWTGIVLIAAYGVFLVFDRPHLPAAVLSNFLVWAFTVAIITAGAILTFKDSQDKPADEPAQNPPPPDEQ